MSQTESLAEALTFDPDARGAKGAKKAVDRVEKLQKQLEEAIEAAKNKAENTLRPKTGGRKAMSAYQKAVKQLGKSLEVIGFQKFEYVFLNEQEPGLAELITALYAAEDTEQQDEESCTLDLPSPPSSPLYPPMEELNNI